MPGHDGSPATLKVFKNSGARQCEQVAARLSDFAKTLSDRGIRAFSSTCAADGLMRLAVCGSDAGLFYVYEIDAKDLAKARDLGFAEIGSLPGYRERPCPA